MPTQFDFNRDLKPIKGEPGFFKVVNPIYVFKKVYNRGYREWDGTLSTESRIANLIIPVGATMFIGTHFKNKYSSYRIPNNFISHKYDGKLRADRAFVHSIVDRWSPHTPRKVGHGWYDRNFIYRVGETVVPKQEFSFEPAECESGIHFFLSLDRALAF